jgi:hypothetical protein
VSNNISASICTTGTQCLIIPQPQFVRHWNTVSNNISASICTTGTQCLIISQPQFVRHWNTVSNNISSSICTPLEDSVHKLIKGTPKWTCGTLADQTCLPLFLFTVCVWHSSHYTIPTSVMKCLSNHITLA